MPISNVHATQDPASTTRKQGTRRPHRELTMYKAPPWWVEGLWGAPVVARRERVCVWGGSGGGAEGGPGGLAGDDVFPVVGGEAVEASVDGVLDELGA